MPIPSSCPLWLSALLLVPVIAGATAAVPLLPADQLPAGMRLQATVVAAQAARSFALFAGGTGNSRKHPGDDLGNGLALDSVGTDRIWVSRDGVRYQLRLQPVAAGQRAPPPTIRSPSPPPSRPGTPIAGAGSTPGTTVLSADSLEQVRAQCDSATMARLSAEHRLEIQAMGLCP